MSEEKIYSKSDLCSESAPKRSPLELSSQLYRRYASLGLETSKTSNIHYVDGSTVVMAGGTSVRMFNVLTSESRYLESVGGGGIGAIAVSHDKKFIAVAERSITESPPNIYVYEYPSLKIYRVLRNGTERLYSALAFNTSDTKLASVGAFPDFMLTVWDWKQEKIILRNKAFSQDIFKVSFFPEDDGILTTSGTGHIRFWKMAQTFTGLKLQGEIGKFGKFDLSDVDGYAEMPSSGMILSGSESGSLLLWDGNFVKLEVLRGDHNKPHDGMFLS
jgi:cilia- and flagella-associated protein 44